MNWKALGSYISKVCLILAMLCLCVGCQKEKYYLDFYYVKTCPVCRSFQNNVISQIEKKYQGLIKITYYDIDEEASRERYAKTCSLLQDYYFDDDSGSVPFIVFDGYFAKVGYNSIEKDEVLKVIDDVIEGKDISTELSNFYEFQKGKTIH